MSGDDVPDPATGLTKREKDILRATWGEIQKDKKEYGFDLFIRYVKSRKVHVVLTFVSDANPVLIICQS